VVRRVVLLVQQGGLLPLALSGALKVCSLEADTAASREQLLELVNCFSPDCAVILCTATVDSETLKTTEQVRRVDRLCPLLIFASAISSDSALRAMRAGASDLREDSVDSETLVAALKCLFERVATSASPTTQSSLIEGTRMVGSSRAIGRVRDQIGQVACSGANVLITGESGTGKELAAELIHRNSPVWEFPFVAVNCAAVPEALLESELFGHERGAFTGASVARQGKLQHASGGTLFLDEVGDMSLLAQAKILRVIETRVVQRLGSNVDIPVQIRLLAATNQDLESLTREKKFRQDLYFRLNVVRLNLPPLRERREDIPDLAEHILRDITDKQHKPVCHLATDVLYRLKMYDWPGNVRELRNVLECILVYSSSRSIGISDVPEHVRHTLRSSSTSDGEERSKILCALNSTDWNRSKAAQILHCSRMTLYRKMEKFSVRPQGSGQL
jgi:DNA-binding NtrC family response regulator